jgi:hypothetical protein
MTVASRGTLEGKEQKMKRFVTIMAVLSSVSIASGSAIAAPLYTWDSVTPIRDQIGDASSGIDIDSIRFARDAGGTKYFRMDVNGTPVIGATYSFFVANSPTFLDPDYTFADRFKNVISFTKTFTNNTDSDATSHFNYGSINNSNKFFLEWSLENDSSLKPTFYVSGKSYLNPNPGGTDTTNVSATPIPSAAWLLASGVLCLIGLQRRNKQA